MSNLTILRSIPELTAVPGPVALAIGVFDGLHLGHQEVIREALDHAHQHGGSSVIMTIDPHPLAILRPDKCPKPLCTTEQMAEVLQRMGANYLLVAAFDQQLAATKADQFIEILVSTCRPLGFVSVGYEWVFGRDRAGNIHGLMELGRHHDFAVCGVPAVKMDGQVVSSTRIREAVRSGDLATANKLLGREFALAGEVTRGKQLGRKLGFPTANIALQDVELPPDGVYAVRTHLRGHSYNGVANLGFRPTVEGAGKTRTFEVHLPDFDSSVDLYGEWLPVDLVDQLRKEKKFNSLDDLKAQIAKDIDAARELTNP